IVAPIPYWFLKGTPGVYRSAMARARLKVELTLAFHLLGFYYKDFQLLDAAVPGWEDLNGLRLPEIAEKWGISPFDALLRLAEKSNGSALILFHTYSGEPGREEVLERVLSHDLCLFETDVLIRDSGRANPAGFGTFPRVLGKYVREKKLFSLENAVKRMTSASAARFGLDDIGLLEPGRAADVVVFDPETVSDAPPQGAGPDGGPAGIRHVFINGEPVVENGAYIPGARAGRVLVE
ncbi:MAG: amidohydrolase family protein, partial [Desulfobacterales bacterium]|nr:amidohydrolase family protein [Desulfobacterales bacterium]